MRLERVAVAVARLVGGGLVDVLVHDTLGHLWRVTRRDVYMARVDDGARDGTRGTCHDATEPRTQAAKPPSRPAAKQPSTQATKRPGPMGTRHRQDGAFDTRRARIARSP